MNNQFEKVVGKACLATAGIGLPFAIAGGLGRGADWTGNGAFLLGGRSVFRLVGLRL